MRKWIFLLFLLGAIGLAWWIWSLGSIPAKEMAAMEDSGVTISDISGDVQVKIPDHDWTKAQEQQMLPVGTDVKTTNGTASINWFESGQTRLAANTQLQITQATQTDLEANTLIKARLVTGRIWTRMLRLLDLDSEMSVETNDVIATVRGTVFDIDAASTTGIWVSDSVVDVQDRSVPVGVQTGKWSVPEGEMIRIGKGIKTSSTDMIPQTSKDSPWFVENKTKDQAFMNKKMKKWTDASASLSLNEGDAAYTLRQWSEQLHGKMKPKEKKNLQAASLIRELGRMKTMVDQGKSGAALHAMSQFDNRLSEAMKQGAMDPEVARAVVKRAYVLFEQIPSDTPEYRLRQRLEDWMTKISSDEAERVFDRLSVITAQADEASQALDITDLERATVSINTADTGLQNLTRELKGKTLSDQQKINKLRSYLHALQVRIDALKRRLALLDVIDDDKPKEEKPSKGDEKKEEKPDKKDTTTTTSITTASSTTASTSTMNCVDLIVSVAPNPLMVGQTGTLTVRALKPDQSSQDVSTLANYQLFGQIATIKGRTITGQSIGSAQLAVKYLCNNKPLEKTLPLQVIEQVTAPRAVSLTIVASPNSILTGGVSTLSAFLDFSDGTRQNVTAQTTWSTPSSESGALRSNSFVAFQTPGTVTINATYIDPQGKSWSNVISVIIQK